MEWWGWFAMVLAIAMFLTTVFHRSPPAPPIDDQDKLAVNILLVIVWMLWWSAWVK